MKCDEKIPFLYKILINGTTSNFAILWQMFLVFKSRIKSLKSYAADRTIILISCTFLKTTDDILEKI